MTAEARASLNEIRSAGERAAGLTRQLLAFSRRQVFQPRVVDLNRLVFDMEKMLHRLIGEDVHLVISLGAGLSRVKIDPSQTEQILMNLAVNSRDAMPRGGNLIIETANVTLDETYTREHVGVNPGAYVRLAVSDTGCGMDAEIQSHLFEPFFTTKGVGKGTGLGLSTVYGIVKQSNGHISVYSEPTVGTTFKIYLPCIQETEAPATEEPKPDARELPPGSGTILLVEDNDGVRKITRQVLQQTGYSVIEAANGEQALKLAEGHQAAIDLLLTDVIMPGINGRELAERLVARRSVMKVLYMSGYTDDAILRHGGLTDGTPVIEKPFTPEALRRKVYAVLNGAPAR
jgi:two-component system cell cycle sensor histidine kinase/response regulator CckA